MRSVILLGAIDILLSCMPHLLTSETLVHHVRTKGYDTACGATLGTIRSSEGMENGKRCAQNVVFSNVGPIA